jgi:hypothetical protein
MATPVTLPPIQNGTYYISTLFPEFYLELQRDSSLRATKLNIYSDAQKVCQNPTPLILACLSIANF